MATIMTMAIRKNETLGLRNKLTHVLFCSVVAGKKLDVFFPARKAVDVRWEVVGGEWCNLFLKMELIRMNVHRVKQFSFFSTKMYHIEFLNSSLNLNREICFFGTEMNS